MKTMRFKESEYRERSLRVENFGCQGNKRGLAKDTEIKRPVK